MWPHCIPVWCIGTTCIAVVSPNSPLKVISGAGPTCPPPNQTTTDQISIVSPQNRADPSNMYPICRRILRWTDCMFDHDWGAACRRYLWRPQDGLKRKIPGVAGRCARRQPASSYLRHRRPIAASVDPMGGLKRQAPPTRDAHEERDIPRVLARPREHRAGVGGCNDRWGAGGGMAVRRGGGGAAARMGGRVRDDMAGRRKS